MSTIVKQTATKRIEYIDALRGFTMILVVFAHINLFSLDFTNSFVNSIFISFRMPLFFFISGFIGFKLMSWDRNTYLAMNKNKLLHQLVPTLILGIIYTCVYLTNCNLMDFIGNSAKLGYWFTIVIFEMYFIFYTLNLCLYNSNVKRFEKRLFISLVLLSILSFCLWIIFTKFSNKLVDAFCLLNLCKFLPYFAFGIICSMNKDLFHRILENKYFTLVIIVLFCIGFYVNRFYLSAPSNVIIILLWFIVTFLIGFAGLLIVYNTFRVYKDSFSSDKKIGRMLQYIGKRTLDIYLLHYFLLPTLPALGNMLSKSNNFVLELVVGLFISLLVIAVCLVVSNILRTNPILAKYLFGVKSKG
jgi:fucose 4-O-acetylase-like acetyltransferase